MKYFDIHNYVYLALLLFLVSFCYRLVGITNQYEVWDEVTVVRYGEVYLNNIVDLNFSKESWELNKEHPPLSKYFYGASRVVSLNLPIFSDTFDQDYEIGKRYSFQRILSALIGSLTVVVLFLFVRTFYNTKTGFLAGLILCFTPYFIAHTRVATQEGLVAFLTLLATYLFFLGLRSKNLMSNKFIFSGIVLGLAISTKYNAIFFLLLYAILGLVVFLKEFVNEPVKLLKNKIILIPVIAIITLIILWPWLWHNPVDQLLASLNSRVGYSRYFEPATEYFLGRYPHNNPWYYFFTYFIVTTPIILLLSIIPFLIKIINDKMESDLWLLLYFLTPFLAVLSPLKIDGIRYIFPIYPALAAISAIGIVFFVQNTKSMFGEYSELFTKSFIGFIVCNLLFIGIFYHPHYLDYYNSLVGGPKNVYETRLFDYGYWGEGIRNAVKYVNDAPGESKTVYFKFLPVHVTPKLNSNVKDIDQIENADYVIINPTGEWLNQSNYLYYDFPKNFEVVYEEKLYDDSPIITVYKRIKQYGSD